MAGKISYYIQEGDTLSDASVKAVVDYRHLCAYLWNGIKKGNFTDFKLRSLQITGDVIATNAGMAANPNFGCILGFTAAKRMQKLKSVNAKKGAPLIDTPASKILLDSLKRLNLEKFLGKYLEA